MAGAKDKGRTRLSAAERKRQMVDAADYIVNRDRSADLSMREVADRAGASRALAYAYFPDRIGLLDALLEGQVDLLIDAGIVEAAARGSVTERACAVAAIYLRHVAAHGEALALVLRDAADATVQARVIMKNHAFAVPFDGKGKTARVEGVLSSRTFTPAQVQHLAKDAGQDPATVEAKPRTEWVLTATGVELAAG